MTKINKGAIVPIIATALLFVIGLIIILTKPVSIPPKVLGESDRLAYVQEFNTPNASSTMSRVQVSTTSTLLLATSTTGYLKYARFTNLSTTTIYVSQGTAAIDQTGIALFASSTIEFTADRNPFLQAFYAISSTSPSNVSVFLKN